jgi:hypothetical protein
MKSCSTSAGVAWTSVAKRLVFVGDVDRLIGAADEIEVALGAHPGADSVLLPLVLGKSGRHQVGDARDDASRQARGVGAILRISAFVLWPEPMDDNLSADLALGRVGALRGFAVARDQEATGRRSRSAGRSACAAVESRLCRRQARQSSARRAAPGAVDVPGS